jgi:predicted component of type VI protein secretion system
MGLNASRHHATICFEDGQYKILPLSPSNPVLINNATVLTKTALRSGDVIRLGGTTLRFQS